MSHRAVLAGVVPGNGISPRLRVLGVSRKPQSMLGKAILGDLLEPKEFAQGSIAGRGASIYHIMERSSPVQLGMKREQVIN